jgi:hypothetical protein
VVVALVEVDTSVAVVDKAAAVAIEVDHSPAVLVVAVEMLDYRGMAAAIVRCLVAAVEMVDYLGTAAAAVVAAIVRCLVVDTT